MKMKRMEMRDITVGEYQFKIRPFGAKDATYIFGDVASIILPILGTVSVASDDKDAVNMEMFDGMDMDKDSLVKALARINGLTNKHSRKQPCSNYQIVIFFHIHSKAIYD